MHKEPFEFQVWYADGSLYQGRVYAASLQEALATLLQEPPQLPGEPEPVRLQMNRKGA